MNLDTVTGLLRPVVEQCGLEIDRIDTMNAGKRVVLRVFLDGDGPEGRGPTLDDIAAATRAISDAMDASDVAGTRPYVLEVSSRGVSRPLTEPKHYRRNLGRLVTLTLTEGAPVTGRIAGWDDDSVTIDIEGAVRSIGYPAIRKAVVQAELTKGDDEAGEEE